MNLQNPVLAPGRVGGDESFVGGVGDEAGSEKSYVSAPYPRHLQTQAIGG